MKNLYKGDFVRKFAQDNDITIKDASEITEAFLAALQDAICDNDKVVFGKFGMFSKVYCRPKEYVHPVTGLRGQAPAKIVVRFNPQFDILRGRDPEEADASVTEEE